MSDIKNVSIILVHGAWADGSSWKLVIRQLQKRNLNVLAAQIPLTSLSDDVAAVKRTISRTQTPVILVGHAYAGAVIGAVTDDQVKALVYVSALAPDEGEAVAQVFYRDKSPSDPPLLAPDKEGFIWMPDSGFDQAFAQNATAEQIALCKAVQRPIALKCIQEPVTRPAWKTKPAWYLLSEQDRMINSKTQRFMAERMKANIRSYAVDHTPLLTASDKVVEVILEAVRS